MAYALHTVQLETQPSGTKAQTDPDLLLPVVQLI